MPLIVLEGLDGAGKSTQIEKLADWLAARGMKHEYLHFPRFDSPVYGELVARFLRGELGSMEQVDPYIVALLFAGDRADAAPMLRGWLDEGKYVLLDRYVYSNIGFQCAKLERLTDRIRLRDWILHLEFEYNRIPRPDVSLFLDVPFEFTRCKLSQRREGEDRSYLQGGKDIHEESLELQRRVREVYLDCAALDPKLHVVHCADSHGDMDIPERIFERIRAFVEPLL